jgi:two-component sensor histidine kinase
MRESTVMAETEMGSDLSGRQSERQLLRELVYRVNHQLAAAIGLVSAAVERSKSCAAPINITESLSHVKSQLESFARIQQLLQVPDFRTQIDGLGYLRQLCPVLRQVYVHSRPIDLVLVEHSLPIDSELCWRLGIIVNELVMSAATHAFGDGPGHIRISVTAAHGAIRCQVDDNRLSSTSVDAPAGLPIVEALTRELSGHFKQRFSDRGCLSTVVLPESLG